MKKSETGCYVYLINSEDSTKYDFPFTATDRYNTNGIIYRKTIISSSKHQARGIGILSKVLDL
jgi:hypothetical protein